MNPNRSTLIAAALAAALAGGTAFAQGGPSSSTPGSAGGPATPPSAAQSGTTATPGSRAGTAAQGAEVSSTDRRFVTEAAQSGMAEVRASQVAATQAQDPQVREYAQRMVDEHTRSNAELMKLASARNITPPDGPSKAQQSSLEKLQKMSGAEFDRAYMKMQVDDHQKAISLYERQAKSGKDPELKAFADRTLSHLREHLKTARSEMRGGDAASSGSRATPSARMGGTTTPGSATTAGSARPGGDATTASGARGGSGTSGTNGSGSR